MRGLGVFALTGFVVSLMVHGATFFGVVPPPGALWILHIGLFIAFVPMILILTTKSRRAGNEAFLRAARLIPA